MATWVYCPLLNAQLSSTKENTSSQPGKKNIFGVYG